MQNKQTINHKIEQTLIIALDTAKAQQESHQILLKNYLNLIK